MGMGDHRKNSEISQNRISKMAKGREGEEEDASRVSAWFGRQPTSPLAPRSMSFWRIIGISEAIRSFDTECLWNMTVNTLAGHITEPFG